jgi:hypothetical protein
MEEDGTPVYIRCSSFKSPIMNCFIDVMMLIVHDIPTIVIVPVVGIPIFVGYNVYKCFCVVDA